MEHIEVVREGTWVFDGSVQGCVRILKLKGDAPNIELDPDDECAHPPTDSGGYYYVVEFSLPSLPPSNNGSRSYGDASVEEAIRYAEDKTPTSIVWNR